MKNILKSIGAVVGGFLVVAVFSVATDKVLEKTGVLPPEDHPELTTDGLLAVATAYRTLYTILGGWLTARLAPAKPMAHAIWLGGLGMLVGTAGVVAFWSYGHHWYPIALVVEAIPCTWLGGWFLLKTRRG